MLIWLERVHQSGRIGVSEIDGRSDIANLAVEAGLCTISERGYFLTFSGHRVIQEDQQRKRDDLIAEIVKTLSTANLAITPLVWREVQERKWRGYTFPRFWVSQFGHEITRENRLYNGDYKTLDDAKKAEEDAHFHKIASALTQKVPR